MSGFDAVWSRDGTNTMSKGTFAFAVSAWTFAGILATMVASNVSQSWELNWPIFIALFVVTFLGVAISVMSDNPLVSFIGYAMLSVAFGLMLGPIIATYTTASVVKVFLVTSGVVAGLGLVGALIPRSLESWASWLLGALVLLLVGYFIVPIAGAFGLDVGGALTVIDWIAIVIFCACVVFDWNRAMRVPRTADNAIDCGVAIYLDWLNIFIRLLAIMGKTRG